MSRQTGIRNSMRQDWEQASSHQQARRILRAFREGWKQGRRLRKVTDPQEQRRIYWSCPYHGNYNAPLQRAWNHGFDRAAA